MTLIRSQVRSLIDQYGWPIVLEALREVAVNMGERENVVILYGNDAQALKETLKNAPVPLGSLGRGEHFFLSNPKDCKTFPFIVDGPNLNNGDCVYYLSPLTQCVNSLPRTHLVYRHVE